MKSAEDSQNVYLVAEPYFGGDLTVRLASQG